MFLYGKAVQINGQINGLDKKMNVCRVTAPLLVALFFGWTIPGPAAFASQYRKGVFVKLEADIQVITKHSPHIILTFSNDNDYESLEFDVDPRQVTNGAGIMVRGDNESPTSKTLPWIPVLHKVQLGTDKLGYDGRVRKTLKLRIQPGVFDFSEPGVYYLTYKHPWPSPPNAKIHKDFLSNTLVIAVVEENRLVELNRMFQDYPYLALKSHEFRQKRPLGDVEIRGGEFLRGAVGFSANFPKAPGGLTPEGLKKGDRLAKVLLIYGNPDLVAQGGEHDIFDEIWLYTTGPVSSFNVSFKKGRVLAASHGQDGDPSYPPRQNEEVETTTPEENKSAAKPQ